MDSEFSTYHRGYDTNLVLRFESSGTVRCVPGRVLADISKDYFVWIFVPRSGPLNTEDGGTVNLRNAGNYSPDNTVSHPTAVRTSKVAMFGAVLFQFLNLNSFHEIEGGGARWLRPLPPAEVLLLVTTKLNFGEKGQGDLDSEGGATARGGAKVGPIGVTYSCT